MKPGKLIRPIIGLLAVGLFLTFTVMAMAQVKSETSTTSGAGTKQVDVERGEVVYVSGNHLILKMESGEIRDIANVPASARVTVGGKEIGIEDVKVGMKLQKTVTTTTTPRIVTKVETVTGKVWHVSPPNTVILAMENNQNQQFKIPKGQKFNVNGQMVDAFELRKGMIVTATRVTETPETQVTKEQFISGKLPPPPPPPPDVPILVAEEKSAPAPEPATPAAPAPTAPKPAKPAATRATAPEPAPSAAPQPAAPEPAAPAAPQPAAPETTMSPWLWVGLIALLVVIVVIVARKKRKKQ